MDEQFLKFKKRIRREIAVKCSLAALAAAVVAVNAVLLPCLLCGVKLFWAWYLLIGLGGAALGGGVALLCLRTNDKKIALRLDRELSLNERVQTALCYKNQSGDLIDLQRGDTAAALASSRKLSFRGLALTIALAAVFLIGACALPLVAVYAGADRKGEETEEPVDPPREVSDWEWQALDELIDYVKTSCKADSYAKTEIVSELEGLKSILLVGVSESGLPTFVRNTVGNIRNAVRDANEQSGVSEEQKTINGEEGEYVVERLYEIFSMQPSGDSESPESPPDEENGNEQESPGNNTGTGELVIDGVPFFDPELGYVSSGDPEVRDKYYSAIQSAMLEGTISRAEWEEIVSIYFADLRKNEEETKN